MEPKEQLAEVMKNTSLIALASSVEDLPNVRILDIFFDEKQNVVVFPTSALSPKVKEFEANDTVAFTTIPQGPEPVVRVQNATVSKSDWSICGGALFHVHAACDRSADNRCGTPARERGHRYRSRWSCG